MKILDGEGLSKIILSKLKRAIQGCKRSPGLAFILVGSNEASRAYIHMKKRRCQEVGILSFDKILPEETSENELIREIELLNKTSHVDGILVQLPLPKHIRVEKIIETLSPEKDIDGFHPINVGKMLLGQTDGFFPCTPKGIQLLLSENNIRVSGKHVVIVGRSNIVGKPLAALLMQKHPDANATVTVVHSSTSDLPSICKQADILVAAIGQPKFITKEMVKEQAVVIDVGINRILNDKNEQEIVGDVDYTHVAPLCSYISPVPKGVGPMTIAVLLLNTFLSYQKRVKNNF